MKFLQRLVESKLTEVLGRQVSFENMKVSLLGGSIEATGMKIAGTAADEMPLLTVQRIRAEISVARALKKEIAIKSLEIQGSVLTIVRRSDGSTNLPPIFPSSRSSRSGGGRLAAAQTPSASAPEAAPRRGLGGVGDDESADDAGSELRAWDFEAANVSLREGAVRVEWALPFGQAFRASIEEVSGRFGMADGAVTVALQANSIGRRDKPVELGPARITARLDGVENLKFPIPTAAHLAVAVGPLGNELRVEVQSNSPAALALQGEAAGTVDIALLLSLLPAGLTQSPRWMLHWRFLRLMIGQSTGSLTVAARGEFSPMVGFRIIELNLSGKDLTLPTDTV